MQDENDKSAALNFDPDALRRKYVEERAKRLRPDGTAQYQPLAGRFAHLAEDPHADPNFARDPVHDDIDVLIIGGGLSGLTTAARLRQQGVGSIRIVEKGADFGGTWYWNRYPGVACDVEALVYLPMLEELGYVPSERYPKGAEILTHCRKLAERFELYPAALFQTQVERVQWNGQRWI